MLAAAVLSACGSSKPAPGSAPAPHMQMHAPGSIVFVAGGPSRALGVNNTDLLAATQSGDVRDLTSSSAAESEAAWSADGRHVVYLRQSATGRANGALALEAGVYVWSPGHGSKRIRSCSDACSESDFAWSPDDRQIAFVVGNGWSSDNAIEVMNADGSDVHTVCDHERCDYGLAKPMWSPDGRKIVFSIEGGLNSAPFGGSPPSPIWIANADGSALEKLTQPNCGTSNYRLGSCAFDAAPTWSPNGRLIAFSRYRIVPSSVGQRAHCGRRLCAPLPPRFATSIEVMRPDGSHRRSLYRCEGTESTCNQTVPLAWAPDGKSIAFGPAAADEKSIHVTTLTGDTTTIRTCSGSRCLHVDELAWSPNGKQLAFLAGSDKQASDVWLVSRDGTGLHRVTGGTCCLAWVRNVSLDGAKAVPALTRGGNLRLSGTIVYDRRYHAFGLLSLATAGIHELRVAARAPKEPAWSPDGQKIAFMAPTPTDFHWHIQIADGNGKNVRDLARGAADPAWSPDGRYIAFTQDSGGGGVKHSLVVVSAAGGEVRRITSAGRQPSWSPTGDRLVFDTRVRSGYALFTVGVDGRGSRRLTDLPGEQGSPAWSPDGKEIAFDWWSANGVGLYLIRPDGTHLRRVTTAAVPVGRPAWSPDSRYLVVMPDDYQAKSTPVLVIDVRSGRVSTVATVRGAATDPSWSPR
jgi:Tol biopolymer transport system component